MAMMSAKRRQIECHRDFIVERWCAGHSLRSIYAELTVNGDLPIKLRTFLRHAGDLCNSLSNEQIKGRGQSTAMPSATSKVLTPDFSPKNTKSSPKAAKPSSKNPPPLPNPARAKKFVSTGTGSTKAAFTMFDAYGADGGEDADDS